jgi:hypothetical protein
MSVLTHRPFAGSQTEFKQTLEVLQLFVMWVHWALLVLQASTVQGLLSSQSLGVKMQLPPVALHMPVKHWFGGGQVSVIFPQVGGVVMLEQKLKEQGVVNVAQLMAHPVTQPEMLTVVHVSVLQS